MTVIEAGYRVPRAGAGRPVSAAAVAAMLLALGGLAGCTAAVRTRRRSP